MVTEIVDLDLGSNSNFKIITMQGDIASRFIEFHLTYNNEIFDLTGKTVSCRYLNDNNIVITTNLVINDKQNGICTLDVPYELMKNPYVTRSELIITQSNETLSTIPFTVEVAKSLVKRATVESSNEFGALNNALWKIDGVDSRINGLSSQLDSIENSKMNKTDILSMANIGQDIKEAMTGGSVAVVGKGSVLDENINKYTIRPNKTTFFEYSDNLLNVNEMLDGKQLYFDGSLSDNSDTMVSYYIPVNVGDTIYTYYFLPNRTDGAFLFYTFYNANYEIVQVDGMTPNVGSFIIPEGVAYIRVTIRKIFIETNTLVVSTKILDNYVKYKETIKTNLLPYNLLNYMNFRIVDKNGKGDYTSINEAYSKITDDNANNKYTLLIMPGIYEEVVKVYGDRHVSLIGVNKKDCIILDRSGLYANTPLMISGDCYVKNLTVIEEHPNPTTISGIQTAYAIHVDSPGEGTTWFENCRFWSNTSAALGAGGQQNQTVIFKNCEFESVAPTNISDSGYGAIFVHSYPVAENSKNQKFIFENCKARSRYVNNCVYLSHVNGLSGMDITFINNNFFSHISKKDCVTIYGEKINITEDSYGNNVAILNK